MFGNVHVGEPLSSRARTRDGRNGSNDGAIKSSSTTGNAPIRKTIGMSGRLMA